MPTANTANSKPRAAPMSMGMLPVDPKKFRVETVTPKTSEKTRTAPSNKSAAFAPRPSSSSKLTARANNGIKSAQHKVLSPSPGATASFKKHRDISRSERRTSSKRSSPAVRTPTTPMFDDDDDDDDDDDESKEEEVKLAKKRKLDIELNLDNDRIIFDEEAFSKDSRHILENRIHAADIAHIGSSEKPNTKFTNLFKDEIEDGVGLKHAVELQYPSLYGREKYNLVKPKDKEDLDSVDEIIRVIKTTAEFYLSAQDAEFVSDEGTGLVRKIRRAIQRDELSAFHETVKTYNTFILNLLSKGTIKSILSHKTSPLPLPWVERILDQTLSRTVSLQVKSLRAYENGTDNVYGELLPRFISTIFRETRLTSSQIFVDLGSGVGNVVLQAALEIGCESWGCEMMPNACHLASLQHREFTSRCSLWGLQPGSIHLEQGNFLTHPPILSILKRADVILINNQAFTPSLNDALIMHFLDLKEGCQIVSLKSFVPQGHKIQPRNVSSPINLLVDRQLRFWSDSVSWTDAPGTYHVARKDRTALERFMKREEEERG